jgi:hypothetical protein
MYKHLIFGRLFTDGAVFFAPPQTVIYHLWSREHRPSSKIDLPEVISEKQRSKLMSQQLVHDMLKRNSELLPHSEFGLGVVRTIQEYEVALGVSFHGLCCDERRKHYHDSIFAPDPFAPLVPEQNSKSTLVSNNIKIFGMVQSYL